MQVEQRGRLLVAAQFLLIALVAFAPGSRIWTQSVWTAGLASVFILIGTGLLLPAFRRLGPALRANPVPKLGASLQTSGIYAWIRHPIYSGVLALGLGVSICRATTTSFLFFLALAVLLNFKARWEERLLESKHQEYSLYLAQVPRFLPWSRKKEPK